MDTLSEEVEAFLSEPRFAVVATINGDGTPQQSVLWYDLRGDKIMMNTRVGRVKEKNLKRDPRISFCLEDDYNYLTLTGTAILDYDPQRSQDDIKALAVRYHGQERGERMSRDQFSKQERVSIYFTIDKASVHF